MSEWLDNQRQSSNNIRQLLQERIDKADPRRKLTSEEAERLKKLEAIEKELVAEKKQAIKEGKKDAVAEVKRLILKHSLTKGDIRGKAMKQLEG